MAATVSAYQPPRPLAPAASLQRRADLQIVKRAAEEGRAGGGAMGSRGAPGKRKSAVELLAETKAFYVKSETVLDKKQELPLRVSTGLGQAIAAGGCLPVSSSTLPSGASIGTSQYGTWSRRSGTSDALQSTLRRLLEHADSRESVCATPPAPHATYTPCRKLCSETRKLKDSRCDTFVPTGFQSSGNFSGNSSSGTSGSKTQIKSDPEYGRRSAGRRPPGLQDARVFFPDSFVVPAKPAKAEPVGVFKNSFSLGSSFSSPEQLALGEEEVCVDELSTISPPAEYARTDRSSYTYHRWSSQCAEQSVNEEGNINSHKSLPDLHTHCHHSAHRLECEQEERERTEAPRRHSSHHARRRISPTTDLPSTYSSRGTRSNRSSVVSSCEGFPEHRSPAEGPYSYNRSGSSFAGRDSGGSSGHCTARSAPPVSGTRRDSGASTQHTHPHTRYTSYYTGVSSPPACAEWPVSAPLQFQDGAPSPPHVPPQPAYDCGAAYCDGQYSTTLVGIHFQASIPPPAFQDEQPSSYQPPATYRKAEACYSTTLPKAARGGARTTRDGYPAPCYRCEESKEGPLYQEIGGPEYAVPAFAGGGKTSAYSQRGGEEQPGGVEPLSPLGTFKRQRCLRYKQRRASADRRPILRSKSDISDRYWRNDCKPSSNKSLPSDQPVSPDERCQLDVFFERLGLDELAYCAAIAPAPRPSPHHRRVGSLDSIISKPEDEYRESPVFFSDVSTVDSNQIANNADYTVHGLSQTQTQGVYRSTEPPSIVERNARIIKWLCNCRKIQMAQ